MDYLAKWQSVWEIDISEMEVNASWSRWLRDFFPGWILRDDFCRFVIPEVDLELGDLTVLKLAGNVQPPLYSKQGFEANVIGAGLIPIGASIDGDVFVIDTLGTDRMECGFVSHELASNEDSKAVRSSYNNAGFSVDEFIFYFCNKANRPVGYRYPC